MSLLQSTYLLFFTKREIVIIIVGIPPAELKYKAISHVWGNHVEVKMTCTQCGAASRVRLKSPTYFRQVMALAGADNYVWLDSMSIAQDDAQDVAAQIAVMGDHYCEAGCVSVLLPAGDQKAYEALAKILENANSLVNKRWKVSFKAGSVRHELKQPNGKWETTRTAS